jgi:SSS family solute:Na+ symporter
VVVGGMYIVGPDLCSRVLVARSADAARRGAVAAGLVLIPCSLVIVFIGVFLQKTGVVLDDARDALPWLVTQAGIIPAPLSAVVSLGLLAAMLSSADTCLLTAASVFELDVIGRRHSEGTRERLGRAFVGLLGVASMLLAALHPRIIPNMLLAYAFYSGGLLVPLLLLVFPRIVRRIPQPAAWVAMGAGGLTPVCLLLSGKVEDLAVAGLGGVVVSGAVVVIGVAIGLLTGAPRGNRTAAP